MRAFAPAGAEARLSGAGDDEAEQEKSETFFEKLADYMIYTAGKAMSGTVSRADAAEDVIASIGNVLSGGETYAKQTKLEYYFELYPKLRIVAPYEPYISLIASDTGLSKEDVRNYAAATPGRTLDRETENVIGKNVPRMYKGTAGKTAYAAGVIMPDILLTLLTGASDAAPLDSPAGDGDIMGTEDAGESLKADDITSIYRAVGPDEYYSVVGSGKFNTIPTGMGVKQFGLDRQDTINFAERYPDLAAILKVKIPKSVLNNIGDFTKADATIFKNGTVTIQPENLDIFNKNLKEILHIY